MKRFASSESTATELVPMWTVPLSLFQTDQCPVENRQVELKTSPSWCDTHLAHGGCCSGDGQQGETDEFGADCWPAWNICQEQWQHGQQHRQEECSWDAEGNCYIGTWLNGLKHGLGTMWHCGGDISSGEWKFDHQSGRAWKVYAAANDYYVGEFMNGKRSGTGFYMWSNGDQYFGEWKDGAACGVGTKQMSNGSVYTGSWSAGMADGYGTKIFSDGSRYEGSFLQDLRHGFGKYTWSHNEWVEGYWANGALHGDATHHYTNGAVFKGQWKAGKKHGLGLLTMSNRSFHQTWKDGHCTVHEETRFLPPRLMSQTNDHFLPASYLSLSQEVARLERAREEKDNIEDRCLVCYQSHITAVLDPCGHLCVCLECSTALDLCPICRAHVRRVIRVFRA